MDGEHVAPGVGQEPPRGKPNGRDHGPTPIAQAAAEYARFGWPLVLLPPRSKGGHGMAEGWNLRENAVTDPDDALGWHGNFGLLLAFAGVASIDVDDIDGAGGWLEERGVNLVQLLAAPDAVRIESGVVNRAKLLYRVSHDVDTATLLTQRIHAEGNARDVILELRCAGRNGVTMQDVLPPSIHPDTGQSYRWRGDWHKLPVLPPAMHRVWRGLLAGEAAPGAYTHRDDRRGSGTGADFLKVLDKLERLDCKPHVTRPGDARAHCPVHRGKSGTTLHVNEKPDGKVLVKCHAGCTQDDVLAALDMGPGPEVRMDTGPRVGASTTPPEADTRPPAPDTLPPLPASLCALRGRLGEVQDHIASTMLRPHAGVAGLVALALVDFLAMERTRIASRGGLAMGEFFLVLAPTAFGKESLRTPFRQLAEWAPQGRIVLPDLHYNAPASQQGLQESLAANRCVALLADEFGDWMAKGDKDQCREQAMAHMMQVYGNPFGVVATPYAVTRKVAPVRHPRLMTLCTSTGARFSEVVNGSMADRGFLNRLVILPVGSEELELNSDLDRPASAYEIPPVLCALAAEISGNEKMVTFEADAKAYANDHFRAVLDPLALRDARLAGRLNEQAIRMAAGLALSDGRCVIGVRDMATAYEIREGLHARTVTMFAEDESLSGDHPTVRALNVLRRKFTREPFIYRSHLGNHSREYRRLDVNGQNSVVRALVDEGTVKVDGKKLVSTIFVDGVDAL
ncbi:MAG TPA: bifunctional DNA primase/polymerase [Lysobacter sp.]